jgi:hypothetical protein
MIAKREQTAGKFDAKAPRVKKGAAARPHVVIGDGTLFHRRSCDEIAVDHLVVRTMTTIKTAIFHQEFSVSEKFANRQIRTTRIDKAGRIR